MNKEQRNTNIIKGTLVGITIGLVVATIAAFKDNQHGLAATLISIAAGILVLLPTEKEEKDNERNG